MNENPPDQPLQTAAKLHQAGQITEAVAIYNSILARNPNQPDALHLLGVAALQTGQSDRAVELIRRAIAIRPGDAMFHNNLAYALREKRKLDEAIATWRHAIRLDPNLALAHNNLGNALSDQGKFEEAASACQQALRLDPGSAEAHNNLGIALFGLGQLDQAIASYRQALRIKPDLGETLSNLGNALRDAGQLNEAIDAFRRAIELMPNRTEAHSNLFYLLHFHPDFDAEAILAEARNWAHRHADPLAGEIHVHENDPSPDRKLKVAFISPDFRQHPVGRCLLLLLEHFDRSQIEIFCYADPRQTDEITARLKGLTDHWVDIAGLDDQAVAELIRGNGIDLLIDTTLHTAHNRLLVFAREPAPVQLTLLGPPITTGLSTMHYRLTDRQLDPPGLSDCQYTEKSIRLPNSFWCYQPPESVPPVNDLPARKNGWVNFGCLNQSAKVTRPALELWLQILQSLPNARLMIQSQPGNHLDVMRRLFDEGGVAANRVQFVGRTSQYDFFLRHNELDICLDPMPCNGHTTLMDALWMGVPTVTLRGKTGMGRGGASILSNVGLSDWIADTPRQYVAIATAMAADLVKLAELRSTLRQRISRSPLMDGKQYSRDVEAAFRGVWRDWCLAHGGHLSTTPDNPGPAPDAAPG